MDRVALFEVTPAKRWTGSRALVVVVGCPDCGGPLVERTVGQMALFVHGGYGADRTSTWAICANRECRWSIERVRIETKPLHHPAR